jgi:ferritin-like metal-binding protein YciE
MREIYLIFLKNFKFIQERPPAVKRLSCCIKTASRETKMGLSLGTLLCAVYLVEQKSLDVLTEQLETAGTREARKRIKAHLVETQWQIKLLEACMEFQGIDRNIPDKEASGLADEIGSTGLFGLKRFEIELYKRVIAAAREQGAPEVLQACREIMEQERAMAEWIEDSRFEPAENIGSDLLKESGLSA